MSYCSCYDTLRSCVLGGIVMFAYATTTEDNSNHEQKNARRNVPDVVHHKRLTLNW
jgi:hypothetical protein